MAKVVDITEKLSFDENPRIKIRGEEFEINSDAKTMLEIMGGFANKGETRGSIEAYEKMFSEKDREKLEAMKLPFKDFMTIIKCSMELLSGEDEAGENSDPYYDLIDDFDLVISSFQSQYGLRLSRELQGMKWNEFKAMLVGISPDTALGRIVAIRAEERKEVLETFTEDQHRIRNEWKARRAKEVAQTVSEEQMDTVMENIKQMFLRAYGGN